MRQCKLIQEIYKACFTHDGKKLQKLRKEEFEKIFKCRAEGKTIYTAKWTVVQI